MHRGEFRPDDPWGERRSHPERRDGGYGGPPARGGDRFDRAGPRARRGGRQDWNERGFDRDRERVFDRVPVDRGSDRELERGERVPDRGPERGPVIDRAPERVEQRGERGERGGRDGPRPVRREPRPKPILIDREKTCPMLLRVFPNVGKFHAPTEFQRGLVPEGELQLYTWMDVTLRDLSDLVRKVNEDAAKANSRLTFAFVYPDARGNMVMREVGSVHATTRGQDDMKTLQELRFVIGDYLDICIIPFEQKSRRDDRPFIGDIHPRT